MSADHMCPGDRAKWIARQHEEQARLLLGDFIEATRAYVADPARWRGIESWRQERAWLAVDLEGGRD